MNKVTKELLTFFKNGKAKRVGMMTLETESGEEIGISYRKYTEKMYKIERYKHNEDGELELIKKSNLYLLERGPVEITDL